MVFNKPHLSVCSQRSSLPLGSQTCSHSLLLLLSLLLFCHSFFNFPGSIWLAGIDSVVLGLECFHLLGWWWGGERVSVWCDVYMEVATVTGVYCGITVHQVEKARGGVGPVFSIPALEIVHHKLQFL